MMSLDEAIKHAEEVADTPCFTDEEAKCYSEHRQLAEWLKELKAYKEQSGDEELDFVPEHKKIPCAMTIGKPCEDAISRQAVLEQINCWIGSGEYRYTNATHYLTRRMQELPPVNPQPKMGHWKKKEDDTRWWYVCSECEQEPLKNRWNDDDVLSTFCPNCGAKMQEVEG